MAKFEKGKSGNPSGRPRKDEWLKGKGIDALKVAYEILQRDSESTANRLAAARMLAEYDLGKPQQRVEQTNVNFNAGPEQSLAESLAIIREMTGGDG